MSARTLLGALTLALLTACGGGSDSKSTVTTPSSSSGSNTSQAASTTPTLNSAYSGSLPASVAPDSDLDATAAQKATVLSAQNVTMPGSNMEAVSAPAAITATNEAAALPGTRGIFADFHTNVAPLLPQSSLVTAQSSKVRPLQVAPIDVEQVNKQIEDQQNVVNPPPVGCPGVECATECVEANAEAIAGAWAWAAAKTCAWAQAWACVYSNIPPFNRVCMYAKSSACATAFAAAFAFDYEKDTEKKCLTVCSNGHKVVQQAGGAIPAAARH